MRILLGPAWRNPGGSFFFVKCHFLFLKSLVLVVFLLSMTAMAVSPRMAYIVPALNFDGKTANCYVEISADSDTDYITVTATLWRGSTDLETWTESGYGFVYLSESKDVSIRGVTYKLTADVTINGRQLDQVYTTAKCPTA